MNIPKLRCGRLIVLLVLLTVLVGCSTVPETGRRQLLLVNSSEMAELGLSEFQKMKQEQKVNTDPQINAMVTRVGQRIAAVAPLPNAQWEFVVFENPEPNAFCLPGGKIGVHTGILPITKTEAGLATVMGHEVAHAVAQHGAERISQGMMVQAGGQLIGYGMQTQGATAQSIALTQAAYGMGANVGAVLPHSRFQESEADHLGLLYMARAGYDPAEAVEFWKRFQAFIAENGGSSTPWFLRTHPLDQTRIDQLQAWLPEAQAEYRPQ